ncbi:MAG: peptidoglycan DD-metalloendopeptidase family protein, partial [Chitinophagaceae bacterium]
MKTFLLTCLFSLATCGLLSAQTPENKAELQKERKEIQNELKQIQEIHKKLKVQTKQSLGQLTIMKREMDLQERYVTGLSTELKLIDDDINRSNLEINRLLGQLDTLKSLYARTSINAKNKSTFSYVGFVFSAMNVSSIVSSLSYLKSYRAYREKQMTTMKQTQQLISIRRQQKTGKKQQRNKTFQDRTKQQNTLADKKKTMNSIVSTLKSQDKDLQKEIAAKRKRDAALEKSILAIVKKDEGELANSGVKMEETNLALGMKFENNRGKLPWPVDGVVSTPFGPYKIEGTSLVGDSPGLTIATADKNASVKAVFDGVVTGVDSRGEITTVYINHGKYYTVYSNLGAINVTKGTLVKTGQVIGSVGEAYETSGGELIFILMAGKNNDNPAKWLQRH